MPSTEIIVLRTFQALGITLSGMLFGTNVAYTVASVPLLQLPEVSPAVAAKQWQKLYDIGKTVAIMSTISSAVCNSYVLYRARYSWPSIKDWSPRTDLLLAAIIAQLSFIAYTGLFMEAGTNKRMAQFAAEAVKGGLTAQLDAGAIRTELGVWGFMNGIRALFPAAGALLGLASVLA